MLVMNDKILQLLCQTQLISLRAQIWHVFARDHAVLLASFTETDAPGAARAGGGVCCLRVRRFCAAERRDVVRCARLVQLARQSLQQRARRQFTQHRQVAPESRRRRSAASRDAAPRHHLLLLSRSFTWAYAHRGKWGQLTPPVENG